MLRLPSIFRIKPRTQQAPSPLDDLVGVVVEGGNVISIKKDAANRKSTVIAGLEEEKKKLMKEIEVRNMAENRCMVRNMTLRSSPLTPHNTDDEGEIAIPND